MIEIHFGGHLVYYAPGRQAHLELPLEAPARLAPILAQLGIPLGEIAVTSINGAWAGLESAEVRPGDRIELFPPMGGG